MRNHTTMRVLAGLGLALSATAINARDYNTYSDLVLAVATSDFGKGNTISANFDFKRCQQTLGQPTDFITSPMFNAIRPLASLISKSLKFSIGLVGDHEGPYMQSYATVLPMDSGKSMKVEITTQQGRPPEEGSTLARTTCYTRDGSARFYGLW